MPNDSATMPEIAKEERRASPSRPPLEIERILPLHSLDDLHFFGYRLGIAAKLFDRCLVKILQDEQAPVTLSQWRVVAQLHLVETGTVRSLAEGGCVDRAEVSRAARDLVADGFVSRTPNRRDRRSPTFSLTPAGLDLYMRLEKPIRAFLHDLLQPSGKEDVEQAASLLWTIAERSLERLNH
ncbi:MAG TPA: MarR family transcriptional regulator [Sphingomonadaceae bacterium]|jgi:DNA-binding MarR family transcriptional regulator|nr:MarR family transcriptional regulator [Sphingomonadaceae bacterium]